MTYDSIKALFEQIVKNEDLVSEIFVKWLFIPHFTIYPELYVEGFGRPPHWCPEKVTEDSIHFHFAVDMSPEEIAKRITEKYDLSVTEDDGKYTVGDNFSEILTFHKSLCSTFQKEFICLHVSRRRLYDDITLKLFKQFPFLKSVEMVKEEDITFYSSYLTNEYTRSYINKEWTEIAIGRFSPYYTR